jgi:hypothetical protein
MLGYGLRPNPTYKARSLARSSSSGGCRSNDARPLLVEGEREWVNKIDGRAAFPLRHGRAGGRLRHVSPQGASPPSTPKPETGVGGRLRGHDVEGGVALRLVSKIFVERRVPLT